MRLGAPVFEIEGGMAGTLEIFHAGAWGSICPESLGTSTMSGNRGFPADVVCPCHVCSCTAQPIFACTCMCLGLASESESTQHPCCPCFVASDTVWMRSGSNGK